MLPGCCPTLMGPYLNSLLSTEKQSPKMKARQTPSFLLGPPPKSVFSQEQNPQAMNSGTISTHLHLTPPSCPHCASLSVLPLSVYICGSLCFSSVSPYVSVYISVSVSLLLLSPFPSKPPSLTATPARPLCGKWALNGNNLIKKGRQRPFDMQRPI